MIKPINMLRVLLAISVSLLISCSSTDPSSSFYHDLSQTIYSSSNENNFENLVLILNIKNDSSYLVLDQIDEVKLKVNNADWASIKNQQFDNSGINYSEKDNFNVAKTKVPYLLVSGQTINGPETLTAGAFSDYLNNFIYLAPGDYVLEISEIKFRNLLSDTVTLKPRVYANFTVLPDIKSLFLGEFEIEIP